jgi:hypothetical protein
MGSKGGRAPPPPDPTAVATAQTGSNIGTAIANQTMANTNQYGPRGSLTYNQVGTTRLTLPNGESYELPQWEQRETLSPNQQVLANQQENLGIGLNDLAGDQITRLAGVLGRPVSEDVAGVPRMVSSFAQSGPIQSSVDLQRSVNLQNAPTEFGRTAGNIQYDVPGGTDFSTMGREAQDAILARLRPELDRSQAGLDARLANQGIDLGSEAYRTAQTIEQQRTNDARLAAVREGYALENQLYNQALAGGQFHNAAQQQDYGQQFGRGQFAHAGIGMNNQNALNAGNFANSAALNAAQFANAAQAQAFGQNQAEAHFNNQAAQQALQQTLTLRNQPLNEISALMSGGQVSLPQFQGYNPAQVQGTPIGQYIYNTAGIQQQQYQQQQQNQNAMLAGLFGLGSAGLFGLAGGGFRR